MSKTGTACVENSVKWPRAVVLLMEGLLFLQGLSFFFLLHYEEFLVISVWIFTSDIIEKIRDLLTGAITSSLLCKRTNNIALHHTEIKVLRYATIRAELEKYICLCTAKRWRILVSGQYPRLVSKSNRNTFPELGISYRNRKWSSGGTVQELREGALKTE